MKRINPDPMPTAPRWLRGLAQLVIATAAGAAVAVMILVVYALARMVL